MIQVSAGQSLLDVALQQLGSADAVYALAAANGLAPTDALTPGQWLALPAEAAPDVAAYFAARGQRINTGDDAAASTPPTPAVRDHHSLDNDLQDFA